MAGRRRAAGPHPADGRSATHGALQRLSEVSRQHADGRIYLTRRANLQLRGLSGDGRQLTTAAMAAIESTGLLPTRTHELVRNVLVSPQTGLAGGRADLRSRGNAARRPAVCRRRTRLCCRGVSCSRSTTAAATARPPHWGRKAWNRPGLCGARRRRGSAARRRSLGSRRTGRVTPPAVWLIWRRDFSMLAGRAPMRRGTSAS